MSSRPTGVELSRSGGGSSVSAAVEVQRCGVEKAGGRYILGFLVEGKRWSN